MILLVFATYLVSNKMIERNRNTDKHRVDTLDAFLESNQPIVNHLSA